MVTKAQIQKALTGRTGRSAWDKGVLYYARKMVNNNLEGRVDYSKAKLRKALLNGASSWKQASEGGFYYIYNGDIAKRLCNPSEYKKTQGGKLRPNSREDWLDVQARELSQAGLNLGRMFRWPQGKK